MGSSQEISFQDMSLRERELILNHGAGLDGIWRHLYSAIPVIYCHADSGDYQGASSSSSTHQVPRPPF
jgi:hypothetical protein